MNKTVSPFANPEFYYRLCQAVTGPKNYADRLAAEGASQTKPFKVSMERKDDSLAFVFQGNLSHYLKPTKEMLLCAGGLAKKALADQPQFVNNQSWYKDTSLRFGKSEEGSYFIAENKDKSFFRVLFDNNHSEGTRVVFDSKEHKQNPHDIVLSLKDDIITPDLLLIPLPEGPLFKVLGALKKCGTFGPVILEQMHRFDKLIGAAIKSHHGFEYGHELHHTITKQQGEHSYKEIFHSSMQFQNKSTDQSTKSEESIERKPPEKPHEDFAKMKDAVLEKSRQNIELIKNIPQTEIETIKMMTKNAEKDIGNLNELLVKAKEAHVEITNKWNEVTHGGIPEGVMRFVDQIAAQLYIKQQQSLAAMRNKFERQEMQKDHLNHKESLYRNAEHQTTLSLPFYRGVVLQGITPYWSLAQHLEAMESYIRKYNESRQELNELLERREAFQKSAEQEKNNLNQLDAEIHASYQKLLSDNEKAINGTQTVSAAIDITGAVLGNSHPVLGYGFSIGNKLVGSSGAKHEKKRYKNNNRYRERLAQSNATHELLANTIQTNNTQLEQVRLTIMQRRWELLSSANQAVPSEYRAALHTTREDIDKDIKKIDSDIKSKGKELANEKSKQLQIQYNISQLISIDPSEHHHHKANEQLKQEKQNLEDSKTKQLSLQLQIDTDKNKKSELTKMSTEYDNSILKADRLAEVQDFFYLEIKNAIENQQGLDQETRDFRNALDKGFAEYDFARMQKRKVAQQGFGAAENLFGEIAALGAVFQSKDVSKYAIKGQLAFSLGEQLYNAYDRFLAWKVASDALKISFNTVVKTNPNATLMDAVKLMGPTIFMGNYIVPGVQLMSACTTAFRLWYYLLNGNLSKESNEARIFAKLNEFLESFPKHMNQQFKILHEHLDENHDEEMRLLKDVLKEAEIFHEETLAELKHTCNILQDEIQKNRRLAVTNDIKRLGANMTIQARKLTRKLLMAKTKEEKNESFVAFLSHISDWINLSRNKINRGVSLSRGDGHMSNYEGNVRIEVAAENPEIFSGVIGVETKLSNHVPSLYLLSKAAKYYLSLSNIEIELTESQRSALIEIDRTFQFHMNEIFMMSEKICEFAETIRAEQEKVFEVWRMSIARSKDESIDSANKLVDKSLDEENVKMWRTLANAKRFEIFKIFDEKQIYQPRPPKVKHMTKGMIAGTIANYGTAIAIGSLIPVVGIPIGLKVATVFQGAVMATCATADYKNARDEKFCRELLGESTQTSLVNSSNTKDLSNNRIKVETWVQQDGSIYTQMNSQFSKSIKEIGNRSPAKLYPYHAIYRYSPEIIEITSQSDSLLSIQELKQIHEKLPRKQSIMESDKQLTELTDEYFEWLLHTHKGQELTSVPNPFSEMHKTGIVLPSSDPSLIPLLFPKQLLDACEKSAGYEIGLAAIKEKGVLVPSYSFKLNEEKDSYVLTLEYIYATKTEKASFIEFEVAMIDRTTVESFSTSTVNPNKKIQPNFRDFLLQAMYAGLKDKLGMPGSETLLLNNKKWILPVDRPFPGFFALWEKAPTKISFDHSSYTGAISQELFSYTSGDAFNSTGNFLGSRIHSRYLYSSVEIRRKIRETKKSLEAKHESLKSNYNRLRALCCFSTTINDETMEDNFEKLLGIIKPQSFEIDLERFNLNTLPSQPTADNLKDFKYLVDSLPNKYFENLRNML